MIGLGGQSKSCHDFSITPCYSYPMLSSREQFVQQVIEVVRDKFPAAQVARGEQPFSIKINGQVATLENLYRSTALHPDKASELIQQWMLELLRVAEGPPDLHAGYEELADRIMPMLLREDQQNMGQPMVVEPLLPGLMIAYAVDGPRSLWYVTQSVFDRWKINLDDMHEKALENLVGRSDAIAAHAGQDPDGSINLILFQTMDGFDASRILLPTLHDRLREHLGSPFIAGIPNRDILLCFRDDKETVERLSQQIQTDFKQMPHPISDGLLLVTPDGIAPKD